MLLVTSDNDFVATTPTRIHAFAIDPGLVAGFQPQVLAPAVQVPGDGLKLQGKGKTPIAILGGSIYLYDLALAK